MSNPYRNYDLKKFLESIPSEEAARQMLLEQEENERIYSEFIQSLKINKCFLCGNDLDDFNENEFCFHWFLYPKGIKKKHFNKYLRINEISFFNLDSYLRWLANSEKPIGNINDLEEEKSIGQFFSTTIKFKNIEWAFSVGKSDKEGHNNTRYGNQPHYHIQMKVNGRIFIKFNDYHLKFTDEDLFILELLEQAPNKFGIGYYHGHGMNVLEDEYNLDIIDKYMKVVDDESKATFYTRTLIEAPEEKPISGELIYKIIQESKETKIPVRHILKKYRPDCKIRVIIYPSNSAPEMAKRSGRGKKS